MARNSYRVSMLKALAAQSQYRGERSWLPVSVADDEGRVHVTAHDPEAGFDVGGFNLDYLPPGMGKPTRMPEHVPMHYFGVNADVEVEPEYRKQGIASDMWDALENHIAEHYPGESVIDHGGFSPEGAEWWTSYAGFGHNDSMNHPQIHYA